MSGDSKNNEISLERVLGLLDRWRHLPAYQLERRADVVFALFLPEVLEAKFDAKNIRLIPEFPIKKSLLSDDTTSQSLNVDFLAVEEAKSIGPRRQAFLVELKTDMASRGEKQSQDLDKAAKRGLKKLVKGAIDIALATDQKLKYVHLLKLLADLKLIEYEDSLYPVKQGYSKTLEKIKNEVEENKRRQWPSLELVYVQPRRNIIDFNEFADAIDAAGDLDGIRHTFACYLREWAATDAGDRDPKDGSSP